jgi:hypothetical protein
MLIFLGLKQFHGTAVYWCPLKKKLELYQERKLSEFLWRHLDADLTPVIGNVITLLFQPKN